MPSAKVGTVAEFGAYIWFRLNNLDNVLGFWRARRVRRLRLGSFMRKQAALEEVCKDLTGGDRSTIVAWGDASFRHFGPGNRAVPNKGITAMLRTKCRCILAPCAAWMNGQRACRSCGFPQEGSQGTRGKTHGAGQHSWTADGA